MDDHWTVHRHLASRLPRRRRPNPPPAASINTRFPQTASTFTYILVTATAPSLSAVSEGQPTDMVCDRNAQEQRVQHGSVRDFPQPPSQCANDAHQEADYPQCSRQQSSRQEDTGEQDCRKRVDLRQASCQQEANKYGFWQHSLYEHDLQRLQQLVVRTPESSSLSAINAKRAHDLATVLNMDNPDPSSLCLKCPAPSCRTTFAETTTYRGFEEHTRRHNLEFLRIDLHLPSYIDCRP
ncbi:hypothetical protein KCV03_g10407, partial [Aureobasidium melanogenum]